MVIFRKRETFSLEEILMKVAGIRFGRQARNDKNPINADVTQYQQPTQTTQR